jgi:hypothetical protein
VDDRRDHHIHELRSQVQMLTARLEALESGRRARARQRTFLARQGGSDRQWQEQAIVGGNIADFTGGRACTDDGQACAIVDTADSFVLLAVDDPTGVTRYVKLAAGTGGVTASVTVVIDVNYSTSTKILSETKVALTYTNGLLTDVGAPFTNTIDVATQGACA